MLGRLIAAAMMTLTYSSASATDRFIGTWVGEVKEPGSDAPYDVTMSIFERDGRLFHNSHYAEPLNCIGGGVIMGRSAKALHFVELIVDNRELCSDGSIRVYANGEADLVWEWFYPNGDYAARADLVRSQ